MKKIVFATNNSHKLAEVKAVLKDFAEVISLADIGCTDEIPETGTTLEENAILKAQYIFDRYNANCFADDTGLEVDALDGAPGVYSARYAGIEQNAAANMKKLLENLKNVKNRKARFKTVIALIQNGQINCFEGQIEGNITDKPRGEAGFGYDPIFIPEGYNQTFAQMGADEKNRISHRAKAVKKLTEFFQKQI
jgi:XTP/dITP diphosphohydrolase